MKTVTWNRPPVEKSVFYDDFSGGIRSEVWRALNERWASQNNNGYAEDNCMYTTCPREVAAAGATGGLVVIRSNGDFAAEEGRRRQGGGIVTKRLFGPGRYEVRLKVVPRAGQCSAAWTYFNDWKPTLAERRYSEIDIELPHGGDYRKYSGTTYENYVSAAEKICESEVIESRDPLNDGEWHVLAFEWRTDAEHGDEGIVWYQDGKQVLFLNKAVPRYTATFWIATLFQDAIAWLGDPQFETAYLYLDWVRITEYADPVQEGSAEKESRLNFTGIDLKEAPVPYTDYIANGRFERPAVSKNFKGRDIVSWELTDGASIGEKKLVLNEGACAAQLITAQYAGYAFEAEIETQSAVRLVASLECLSGAANRIDPVLKTEAVCEEKLIAEGGGVFRRTFRVTCKNTEHIRIRLTAERGTAVITRCSLKMA